MNEYLAGGIIGAILGYFVNILLDIIRNKVTEKLTSSKIRKISGQLQELNFHSNSGILPIDHAVPKYQEENIHLTMSEEQFTIPIPDCFRFCLEELGFEYHQEHCYPDKLLRESFGKIGIEDYQKEITESSQIVATQFLDDLRNGYIRFNGYMFAVRHIALNRKGVKEDAALNIDFYKTDYFTYRVFAYIYQKHKKQFNIKTIKDINCHSPFLSSFGIGCFVILNDNKQDYIVLAHRGNNVIVDKDKIHFSMNEAFSMLDLDIYGAPSFKTCLFRGLREELGLNEKYKSKITDYGFLDINMELDRFEAGISCYARVTIDNDFTLADFNALYHSAQDKELETESIRIVKMTDLPNFIKENKNNFSAGALYCLNTLLARYNSGQI